MPTAKELREQAIIEGTRARRELKRKFRLIGNIGLVAIAAIALLTWYLT